VKQASDQARVAAAAEEIGERFAHVNDRVPDRPVPDWDRGAALAPETEPAARPSPGG